MILRDGIEVKWETAKSAKKFTLARVLTAPQTHCI